MKTSSTKLLCFFISFTFILLCKKDGLTKATQNGANTFSCKINGKAFQPCRDQGLFGSNPLLGNVNVDNNFVTANVLAKCTQSSPHKYITINLDNFHGTGEYLLSDENNNCKYLEPDPFPGKKYYSFITKKGKVIITKDDRINYILSGTFEFTAANTDSTNDIVTVTDGRFDINYKR